MDEIIIRQAEEDDAVEILKIYSYYVIHTAISFEYEVPSVDKFKKRIRNTLKHYPYYVATKDNKIVGYAYAGSFVGREAYRFSSELTVYVHKDYKRQGIGSFLYKKLEDTLKNNGVVNLYACVAAPDKEDEYLDFNSVQFHKHLGFNTAGEFCKCGYKFNRWYNMLWLEKIIGEHDKKNVGCKKEHLHQNIKT